MAAIGRVAVAAASVAQETTVALSNINFDFSLVRMEAPLEYRGLGAVLSSKRKHEGEDGSIHITARKLGALFSGDLPPTPNLTRVYGLRASEIVENPRFNPRGSPSHGPFGDYVGADGTSIWAAATSGPGALAVHLLACLLARTWSGPEATSIWSELVAARKALLQSRLQEQEFPISVVTASQIEIERHRLIEWDASARSWIRTADSAKRAQQTQLMLIIDNMDLQIPRQASVYGDVMRVWTQAMTVVEKLVSGVAQSVNTGEASLGLSSWHIYPDICALGDKTTMIEQRDHLVTKGGVVTFGLQKHRDRDPPGISWSMPLAHLRYYGGAVSSQRTVSFKSSKVSFDNIVMVAMGSAMSTWNNSDTEMDSTMRFFIAFADILDFAHRYRAHGLLWPKLFSRQARRILSSDNAGRQEMGRFVGLGWRRYGKFLGYEKDHPPPFFGLTNPNDCMNLLQLPDQTTATMRGMIDHFPVSPGNAILRLVHPEVNGFRMIEYASVAPAQTIDGTAYAINCRWISMPNWWEDTSISLVLGRAMYIKERLGEPCGLLEPHELFREVEPSDESIEGLFKLQSRPRVIAGGTKKRLGFWDDLHSRCVGNSQQRDHISELKDDHELLDKLEDVYRANYEIFLGDVESRVHLYVPRRRLGMDQSQIRLPIDFVTKALESQIAGVTLAPSHSDTPTLSCEVLETPGKASLHPSLYKRSYYKSLAALAAAEEVFKRLPNAEVDLAVVGQSFSQANWAQNLSLHTNSVMSRASAVACISMFESGELDLHPEDLEDVLAVSSSNNLYASEILFCDPAESPPAHAFRHVIGNVGRPGLVLLLSPRNTVLREPDLESWQMVNHIPFDGEFIDNFASTSLHLSLTGYEQPVNINDHGDRDSVVHFVEVVVSAHDRGVWHADLDLLRLATREWSRIPLAGCTHTEEQMADVSLVSRFTSIDNWYEVLDRPRNSAIVRSHSNWIARLALAAIPSSANQQWIISSDKPCCACMILHCRSSIEGDKNQIFLC